MTAAGRLARSCLLAFALTAGLLARPDYRNPPRTYTLVQVQGRTYRLEKTLSQALGLRAARRFNQNFRAGLDLLPAHARSELRSLKLYIMEGPRAPGGGRDNGLEYFRPEAAQFRPDIDPRWAHCVVCYCAQNYLDLSDLWALKVILHEQAHAYQLAHYPEQQPDLVAAWQNARALGLYRNLTDDEGKHHQQAYALTNQLEYFSELSVMYFARCNYPPYDRAELRKYDPQGYAVIEKLWRIGAR
ncbi:MAG: hypothetical protein U0931_04450 [Vulcanimicrobiota bacterium]